MVVKESGLCIWWVGLERYQTSHPISNNIGLWRYQYPIPVPILLCSITMYWFWSEMYTTLPRKISKLYDDDDVLYSLHSTPSPLSLPSSADNGRTMVIIWTVLTAVWSVSYWVSQWKKISPSGNTIQYLQILPNIQLPNASIILTLMMGFGLSHEDVQDKNDWRPRVNGELANPEWSWKWPLKWCVWFC